MRIYTVLSQRISDGTYAPGTRLHIGVLAEEFGGVARDTVTHAIRMLEADGKVERYAGLGWYVKELKGTRGMLTPADASPVPRPQDAVGASSRAGHPVAAQRSQSRALPPVTSPMALRATLQCDLPRQDLGTYRKDGGI
jgi:DNA-binding transcriptional MocR family regulator